MPPLVMKHFDPVITYSPPTFFACVLMLEASEPASRSVRPNAAKDIFFVQGVRNCFFWASLPKRTIGVRASEQAIMDVNKPAQPAASSSLMMAISRSPRPLPPYSTGMLQVRKPASKAFFMTGSGNSWPWS